MTPEEQKAVIKEALHEWLEAKFAQFGKWSLHGILAMVLVALAYLFLAQHGWTPPH
jgi:hypothetical protein